MSYHSLDWRCDACEQPNQHDFADARGEAPRDDAGASSDAPAGGNGTWGSEETLTCSNCNHTQPLAHGALDAGRNLIDPLEVCGACNSNRLYSQKDFNRKLGLAIVIAGAALSPWTYGLSLVVCMGLDYGLYRFVPEITVCYACDAIHRGFQHNPAHRAHDPLLAERFRREARQELGLEEETVDAGESTAPDVAQKPGPTI